MTWNTGKPARAEVCERDYLGDSPHRCLRRYCLFEFARQR